MIKESKENLGNHDTVVQILRTAVDEFLNYLGTTVDDEESRGKWMMGMCSALADIFLGKTDKYDSSEVWNAPGRIDAYLAELFPFPTTDPKERMQWVFVVFFTKVKELNDFASTPGVLSEQWQKSGAELFREFAMMLLGVPTVFAEEEEPTATMVQESVGLSGRQRAMLERWKDYP